MGESTQLLLRPLANNNFSKCVRELLYHEPKIIKIV